MLVDELAVVDGLAHATPSRPELLDAEPVRVNAASWRRLVTRLRLPTVGPELDARGWGQLTRRQLLAAGDRPVTADNACRLLYSSIAWSRGHRDRQRAMRLDALARNAGFAPQLLLGAWTSVLDGRPPAESFDLLLTGRGRERLPLVDVSLATTFLYAAGGLTVAPQCLPLARPGAGQPFASSAIGELHPRSPMTYHRYCRLLGRWAAELDGDHRRVWADQVQVALAKTRIAS